MIIERVPPCVIETFRRILPFRTEIVHLVVRLVPLVQKLADVRQSVPIDRFHAPTRVAHGDDVFANVGQIKVVAVLRIPPLLFGHLASDPEGHDNPY